ncbi:hypothetical protein IID24_03225 [Patescibacteria group bacterium]|nr:hypothetical protein [Patescibacteria group bacterium]
MKIFYGRQTIDEDPPAPYLTWSEGAVSKRLKQAGFDMNQKIVKTYDPKDGWRWEQEEEKR